MAQKAVPAARIARFRVDDLLANTSSNGTPIRRGSWLDRPLVGAAASLHRSSLLAVPSCRCRIMTAPKGSSPRVCGRQHGASTGTRPAAVRHGSRSDLRRPMVAGGMTMIARLNNTPTWLRRPVVTLVGVRPDRRRDRAAGAARPWTARHGGRPRGAGHRVPSSATAARPHQELGAGRCSAWSVDAAAHSQSAQLRRGCGFDRGRPRR